MTSATDWTHVRRGGGVWTPAFGRGASSPEPANWFHLRVKSISRGAGQSAVASAAYRTGERLVDHVTGQIQDYTRRGGVITHFNVTPDEAPLWARDPENLANAVEKFETRRNSKLWREYEIALPASVTEEVREEIARAFAQELVDRYQVAAIVAIHAPSGKDNDLNFHTHILTTTRRVGEGGFGEKTRELDDRKQGSEEISMLRGRAAEIINQALEDAGVDERVDHRSFADRGIDRAPTVHMGVAAAAIERRGGYSIRGALNRTVAEGNEQIDRLLLELAALRAEIVAEEERLLDRRYGMEPAPDTTTPEGPAEPQTAAQDAPPPEATPEERKAAWEKEKRLASSAIEDAAPFREHMEETGEMRQAGLGTGWLERTTHFIVHVQERAVDIARTGWRRMLSYLPGRGREPESPDLEPEP